MSFAAPNFKLCFFWLTELIWAHKNNLNFSCDIWELTQHPILKPMGDFLEILEGERSGYFLWPINQDSGVNARLFGALLNSEVPCEEAPVV